MPLTRSAAADANEADGDDADAQADAQADAVTEEKADDDEVARQRGAKVLDALLVTAESAASTLLDKVGEMMTPEESKSWRVLGSFTPERSGGSDPKAERAARAKEVLLDEISDGISRK